MADPDGQRHHLRGRQLRRGDRPGRPGLRLRVPRPAGQRLRPADLRPHPGPHQPGVRRVDGTAADRAAPAAGRRRRSPGARLAAGPQRLLVAVATSRGASRAGRRQRRRRDPVHPQRTGLAGPGRGQPGGQRRCAGQARQRRAARGPLRRARPGSRRPPGRDHHPRLRLGGPSRLDAHRRPAGGVRGDDRDRLVDHLPGGTAASRTSRRPVPPLPQHPADRLHPGWWRLGRARARTRRRPPGDPAVRVNLAAEQVVALHQLPLQLALRLLRRRLLPQGAPPAPWHRTGSGNWSTRPLPKGSPSSTSPAASRSCTRTSSSCSSVPPARCRPSC